MGKNARSTSRNLLKRLRDYENNEPGQDDNPDAGLRMPHPGYCPVEYLCGRALIIGRSENVAGYKQ